MSELAINLKRLRNKEGLTQVEISRELGIPLSTYRNWEKRGKGHRTPDVKVLAKLAEVLNTTIDELVGR